MDDLYENLENYHDENIIDELKNQNKDLKAKLEEYTSAMARLQNDFDKLNSEYKKLEMNYSSLLKTARAEIERKSDMIKSLNSEKDLLIIKSLQSSDKSNFNARMLNSQFSKKSHELNTQCASKPQPEPRLTSDKSNFNARMVDSQCSKKSHELNTQCASKPQPEPLITADKSNFNARMLDSQCSKKIHELNTQSASKPQPEPLLTADKSNFNARMLDSQCSKKIHELNTQSASKPQPESRLTAANQNEPINQQNNRNIPSRTLSEDTISSLESKSNFSDDKELRGPKNYIRDKTDQKLDNTTKEIVKEGPMQCHKTKGIKICNRRKSMPMFSKIEPIFSSDDDFEALNLKNYRKSPLREDIRNYEKYSNRDNYYRSSNDRYYSNKTNRFTDHNRHDKYESKYSRHSPEKYRTKNIKEHSGTHKLRSDYKNSRQRVLRSPPTDNYNRSKSRDRRTFDRENYYEKQRHSPHSYDYSAVKHKIRNELQEPSSKRQKTELIKNNTLEENIYDRAFMESTTCQSPDYVHSDIIIPHHVAKEIKHTAVTPLEDPRVSSKKYSAKSNKEVISKFDIKPINVNLWNIPNKKKFKIPSTFISEHLPTEPNKQFKDEICADREKPLLNVSLESGEIESFNECDSRYRKESDEDGINRNKNKQQSDNLNSMCVTNSNNTKNRVISKYKIPKVKKPDKLSIGVKHDTIEPLTKNNYANNHSNEIKYVGEVEEQVGVKTSQSTQVTKDTVTRKQHKQNDMIKPNCDTVLPHNMLVTAATLADDLELSDEASENTDLQKNLKELKNVLPKDITSMDVNHQRDYVPLVKDANQNSETKDKGKLLNLKKVSKDSRDSYKSRKSKKKIDHKKENCTKAKEPNKELKTILKLNDKQRQPVMSIQTKNKFCDLFGDSNSLITPDDLGIPPPETQLSLSDKYASIFDNTQDAVDLSGEDISKAQSDPIKFHDDLSNEKAINGKAESDDTLVSKEVDYSAAGNSLYENSATNNASKVMKTVIISTGVQPKYILENITLEDNQKKCIKHTENTTTSMLTNLKALATSTPHKPLLEEGSTATNEPNDSYKNTTDSKNLSSNLSNSSIPNETLIEADIPDVRIFVRRRRKVIKKP